MEFFFWFKKAFSRLIFPAPLIAYPLTFGVILMWLGRTPRRRNIGKICVTVSLALYLLFTATSFPDILLRSLEDDYRPFEISNIRQTYGEDWEPTYIVVLGGDFNPTMSLPVTSRVGPRSTARVSEGVRLHQIFPDSTMIFTGGRVRPNTQPSGEGMAELAQLYGVSQDSIIVEPESKDTKDHVRYLQPILQDEPFIIVTTASHLPRAMALFEHAGMNPAPAPVTFEAHKKIRVAGKLPSAGGMVKTEGAFYEYLGILWSKLRGQL